MCSTPPAICTSVAACGHDVLRRLVDRLQAGAAQPIDGSRQPTPTGKPGNEGGHAGDVITLLLLLLDAAPDNVFDLVGRERHPVQQRLHHVRRQIVGPHIAIRPLLRMGPRNRRSHGFNDDGLAHVASPLAIISVRVFDAGRNGPIVTILHVSQVSERKSVRPRILNIAGPILANLPSFVRQRGESGQSSSM